MKNTKRKSGISLIVLVITIIVMIILSAAIILSISNSSIIEKTTKAKMDSDAATLKEYANILEIEWELMTENERNVSGYTSKEDYVNAKLPENKYTYVAEISGVKYLTLKNAINAAMEDGNESTTIKLLADVSEDITINDRKKIVLETDSYSYKGTVTLKKYGAWIVSDEEINVNSSLSGTPVVKGTRRW